MRHDAQFNLAVIGASDHTASRRYKSLTYFAPLWRADGNILQIGVVARQASCHRNRLRIVGVHPPRFGIGHLCQFVGVSTFELAQRAVFQNFGWQWIVLR